jgi:hypothetical protein
MARRGHIALIDTPVMGWRVRSPGDANDDAEDEPTLVTDMPRLLAKSIHPEAGVMAAAFHPPSSIVLKGGALSAPKVPAIDTDPYRALAPTELGSEGAVPAEVRGSARVLELVVDADEDLSAYEDEDEDADADVERAVRMRPPLRGRIARATASAVFAFVALMLLVMTGVHAQTYRELARAWGRVVVASQGAVAKSADPSPVRTASPSVRVASEPPPVVRTAWRPRAPRHVAPKATGIIREVPF